jgi:hypothetical protein
MFPLQYHQTSAWGRLYAECLVSTDRFPRKLVYCTRTTIMETGGVVDTGTWEYDVFGGSLPLERLASLIPPGHLILEQNDHSLYA